MLRLRPAGERGHADWGWLDTRHTFSFGDYYDPAHMGFRALRVINDDRVAGGEGFPRHPHRDMEIVSYVVSGGLEHRDSLGNGSVIRPGEVQRMSAGTGVTHSEYNASADETVRFLQIWIVPDRPGLEPGYEQRMFGDERRDRLRLVAARDGRQGAVTVHQDVDVYATVLSDGAEVAHPLRPGRHAWAQVVGGRVELNGLALSEGDGVAISDEPGLRLRGLEAAEVLIFDLA